MIGRTVSHYRILEKLGEGGMGVVYKAQDLKLDRTVALKFLPHNLTAGETEQARLLQEARAASALNHPHICAIHSLGEHEAQQFIDMEYVDGKTLRERIEDGGLKIEDGIRYAMQIGEALHEAHTHGIVHRDVKPENIMVGARGEVKVMDFGLARLKGALRLTRTSSTVGTLAYMAPEQIQGGTSDARADIFSFGVVLYEILTGRLPFRGEHEGAMVYSILNEEPQPIRACLPEAPSELQHVVSRALEKDPAERYQTVQEMVIDLRRLTKESNGAFHQGAGLHARRWHLTGFVRRPVAYGLGAAILLVIAAVLFLPGLLGPTGSRRERSGRTMLVVLPFENLGSPDDEYFANGTTDAITARLASVSGLGVVSRQSALQYKKTTKQVRQIGEELGVAYILEGTVQRKRPGDPKSRVRVIPQLIRVADDMHIWAAIYDKDMAEMFRVQSEIAENVATQLDITLLEPERRAIEKRPTENLEAYEAYLRGLDCMYSAFVSEVELSVSLFQKAVSLDPQFAEAWAYLAGARHNLYWGYDRPGELGPAMEAAQRAYQIAPDLPETHLALGYGAYAQREFGRALEYFEKARRLRPIGETVQAIGFTLRRMGRWREVLTYAEEARSLEPRSANVYRDVSGYTRVWMGQFNEAVQDADRAIALSPDVADAHLLKVECLMKKGDMGAAKEALLEMSRRVTLVDVAESQIPQGLTVWTATGFFRLFPETFAKAYAAFEAGSLERYREIQPAVVATTHLARGFLFERMKDRQSARARYDSARVQFERIIRSNPKSAYVAVYQSDLGLAHAGLGRCEEAIRAGEEAVRMMPISKDAVVGAALVSNLAEIYVRCGKDEAAIDQIETCLSVPSGMAVGLLRADPLWAPLRNNPRFRRLVEAG